MSLATLAIILGIIFLILIGIAVFFISAFKAVRFIFRKVLDFFGIRIETPKENSEAGNYFLDGLSGMLAKIAKADGHVSESEIQIIEKLFKSLNLSQEGLKRCIEVFNRAKDDDEPIESYASKFAQHASTGAKNLIYQVLWEVAAVDGKLSENEDQLLRRVLQPLGMGLNHYYYYRRLYTGNGGGAGNGRSSSRYGQSSENEIEEAYRTLGCNPTDSDDTVRSCYRQQAKKYHPDKLRAEGVPESMIEKATQTMAKINNAWNTIRKARKM